MDKQPLTSNESMLCTLHSNDANHQADNLINWQQEYDQLSQGPFLGMINEINFPHMHVFREDTNRGLRQQCRVEDGGLWLGFSANNKSCRINNEESSHKQFLCRPGSQDFELLTPNDFSIFGLVLHKSLFKQLEEQGEEGDALIKSACDTLWLENISSEALTTFQQYLSLLLQSEHRWSNNTQEIILKDAVVELLSQTQQTSTTHVAAHQRQQIMKRVKHYLTESRLKSPVTIGEICSAVHVSRRTLQYTFTQCCGMSPKQYIQITRLNQVRRSLLNHSRPNQSQSNNEEHQTIGEIAFEHGFFHLGQFSQNYKHLFGETPQQTRQRTWP